MGKKEQKCQLLLIVNHKHVSLYGNINISKYFFVL